MSYESTVEGFDLLNEALQERFDAGEPALVAAPRHKPALFVASLDPLSFREYGSFRNRAPRVSGQVAIRGYLVSPVESGSGALVHELLQEQPPEGQIYGYPVAGYNPAARYIINQVAEASGHPELTVLPFWRQKG